ncbi:MAG TPA: ATP-grasp domain-containing protein [Pirellulales bacterium]|jgi:predicted ATP-grasp superfamily ATP-dependent carboligase|nr:ATP-grasp domain-containing protein [Pirellulales bacterium]
MPTLIDNVSETVKPRAPTANWPAPIRDLPPMIVMDGGVNAISIARSLARLGVAVHALNEPAALIRYSRCARWIPFSARGPAAEAWADFLLGPKSEHLRGAVLIAAGDRGLELLIAHHRALAERFQLDEVNLEAQRRMLDKLSTYQTAVAAGVPTPRFWLAKSADEVDALRGELVFPLLVKPTLSHLFEQRFGVKHVTAESLDSLHAALRVVGDSEADLMLVEKIPGPDDRLCSYYTYLDAEGNPQFNLTKRVIRRYPIGQGAACYHVTDHNPEVRELALKLLRHVGLRGLANVEFKRDDRDGRLKLIECNARFTAPNCLIARSGFDLPRFVYGRIVGLPTEPLSKYRRGLRLWYPIEDYLAYRELRRRREMTFRQWLASIAHRQTLPLFQFRDPLPTLVSQTRRLKRIVRRAMTKIFYEETRNPGRREWRSEDNTEPEIHANAREAEVFK